MATPKFSRGKGNFQLELKQRVNEYFATQKIPSTGNRALYFKAGLLSVLYLAIYVHLVFFTPGDIIAIIECILFGAITTGLGFNVMHDGAHESFSQYKTLNKFAAVSINFLGASHIMWRQKHNIIHHTYTNIDGVDDDIEARPFLRLAATQKKYTIHRFQHMYFWFLYALLHLMWIFLNDYKKYFTKSIGPVKIKPFTLQEHFSFWIAKAGYLFMCVLLPIYILGFMKWMIGFLIITTFAGFVLSIVFQLAHTVEHTEFPVATVPDNKIENEWAIHQVATTANFATKNKIISWLVGGLNFQIEHHLFPKISHVHYPAISKIIKKTCQEYGIQYHEYRTMFAAVVSHVTYLKKLGRND